MIKRPRRPPPRRIKKPLQPSGPINRLLAVAGSLLVFLGLFLPFASTTLIDGGGYLDVAGPLGWPVPVLAALGVVGGAMGVVRFSYIFGLSITALAGTAYYAIQEEYNLRLGSALADIQDNPFQGLVAAVGNISPGVGFAVIMIGAGLLFLSSVWRASAVAESA